MKRVVICFFAVLFLFGLWVIPVLAADPTAEIEQLKGEVNKLLQRIQDLEKKQADTEAKTKEAEKKITEVETKAAKVEKKSLKDRIELGGEFRGRIMFDNASTEAGFYGDDQPKVTTKYRDETSFPLRLRLNAHAEVVPDWLDFYARLTLNKRWGAYDTSATDPFNRPNSFESSIGHDLVARVEQAYMTLKVPYINSLWYLGRLPGMDGAPQRQAPALFPRLFIDSEIDGTLIKWNAPQTALDKVNLPWTSLRLWGKQSEPGKAPTLKSYEAKVNDKTGIILGYLKYDEKKLQATDTLETSSDADAFLAQAQIKIGKDTAVIFDGLTMADWHMPNTSGFLKSTNLSPEIIVNYNLFGIYADTQLLGLQLYGAYYHSNFSTPDFTFSGTDYEAKGYPGYMWFGGFNTGDLISPNMQLTVELADGSNAWINPFNYRGYRRKGTVLYPANNYFFDPKGTSTVAGFYPCNARIWDIYYDYYAWKNVRFRLGYMDFNYSKHKPEYDGQDFSFLGSSKYKHEWWPYAEINITF